MFYSSMYVICEISKKRVGVLSTMSVDYDPVTLWLIVWMLHQSYMNFVGSSYFNTSTHNTYLFMKMVALVPVDNFHDKPLQKQCCDFHLSVAFFWLQYRREILVSLAVCFTSLSDFLVSDVPFQGSWEAIGMIFSALSLKVEMSPTQSIIKTT